MKINSIKQTASVGKVVEFMNSDAIALGVATTFIHELVENKKAWDEYKNSPVDGNKTVEKPKKIDLQNKINYDLLMSELTMLDKFIGKLAIRPTDSNIFD